LFDHSANNVNIVLKEVENYKVLKISEECSQSISKCIMNGKMYQDEITTLTYLNLFTIRFGNP